MVLRELGLENGRRESILWMLALPVSERYYRRAQDRFKDRFPEIVSADVSARISEQTTRDVNTATGSFLQQDPMGVSGTNPNLYPWVANDATDKTDPTGRDFGHHWFPRDELKWALSQGLITQDAYWVGFGYYSGELNAAGKLAHGSPIGHPGYNNEVREMIKEYIQKTKRGPLTADEMRAVIDKMISGQHPFDPAKPLPDKIKNLITSSNPTSQRRCP